MTIAARRNPYIESPTFPTGAPGGGGAGTGAGMAPWVLPLLMMAGQAASQAANSASQRGANRDQQQATREQLALEESGMDPFRAVNAQRQAMAHTDLGLNTTPRTTVMGPNGYERRAGGQYTMGPEMTQFLTELRARIASGAAQNPGITPGYISGVQNMAPGGGLAAMPGGAVPRPGSRTGGVQAIARTARPGDPGTQVIDEDDPGTTVRRGQVARGKFY